MIYPKVHLVCQEWMTKRIQMKTLKIPVIPVKLRVPTVALIHLYHQEKDKQDLQELHLEERVAQKEDSHHLLPHHRYQKSIVKGIPNLLNHHHPETLGIL